MASTKSKQDTLIDELLQDCKESWLRKKRQAFK